MSIRTPLPYSFATNHGTASKLKFHDIDAPMHSASCNKPELPRDTVCISKSAYNIHYRVQWGHNNWSYTQIDVPRESYSLIHDQGSVWLTGGSPSFKKHNELMETVKSLHPMVMQLFSS
jgi:hypothetical protein